MSEARRFALSGEAAEVALAEAQAVLAMVQDEDRRGRLADLIAAIDDGEVAGRRRARRSRSCSSSACRPAGCARSTGPDGEQAALGALPPAAARPRADRSRRAR